MNNDIAHSFYAKWVLPIVLAILGVVLIILFLPSTAFVKDKNGNLFYSIGNNQYIGIEDKHYYEPKKNGTEYVMLDEIYDKNIPKYESWKVNMSGIGSATGISMVGVGGIFIIVNVVKIFLPQKNNTFYEEDDDEE